MKRVALSSWRTVKPLFSSSSCSPWFLVILLKIYASTPTLSTTFQIPIRWSNSPLISVKVWGNLRNGRAGKPALFTPAGLQELSALTNRLEQVEGVLSVTSLTNILDIKGEEGLIEIGPAIDPENLPPTPAALEALKAYLLSKTFTVVN